jgi:hypothetical protein
VRRVKVYRVSNNSVMALKYSYSVSCSRVKMAAGKGVGVLFNSVVSIREQRGHFLYYYCRLILCIVCMPFSSQFPGIMSITAAELIVCCVGMYLRLPSEMHERQCHWLCVRCKRGLGSTEHWIYRLALRSGA